MKLLGLLLLIGCGSMIGEVFAAMYRDMLSLLVTTDELLLQMEIIMEYEAPAVSVMLGEVKKSCAKLPVFLDSLPDSGGAREALEFLGKNDDGYLDCDRSRLAEYFAGVGGADRLSELKRLGALRAYFKMRIDEERPLAAKRIKLSRSLGLLGGIFFAVMLL